ncbi:MAG: diguanylate cyclase [Gammaproteobacteria bacterium]|nr:diguanylate cyclase [Gammaproteobacteria bacterium]
MRGSKTCFHNPLCLAAPFVVWTILVAASLAWAVHAAFLHADETATRRGRDLFDMIEITRAWNARHAGVYVVRSSYALPNPYLRNINRDLDAEHGIRLTMIDPAYMARQLSDLARSRGVRFHLTSNNPLRPANAPDAWERATLKSFDQGAAEHIDLLEIDGNPTFRYMAPLSVEPNCLGCHAVQGYQLGQVRGGISVDIDAAPILSHRDRQIVKSGLAHAVIWVVVSVLLWQTLHRLHLNIAELDRTRIQQGRTIERKNRDLKKARDTIMKLQSSDALTGFHNRTHFEKTLQEDLDKSEARGSSHGVLIIELDYFNEYNTEYGILEGDIVLRTVAALMQREVDHQPALFSRYIGSSFAIALAGVGDKALVACAEHLRRSIYELGIKHEHSEAAKFVTVTIGTAHLADGASLPARDLLKRAAVAMYKGKRRGRNCVVSA